MKGRRIQIGLLVAVAAALAGLATFGLARRSAGRPDTNIVSPYGPVRWNHELHARLPDTEGSIP